MKSKMGILMSLINDIFMKFNQVSFVRDENFKFVFLHDSWCEIIGFTKEEMMGIGFIETVPDSLRNEIIAREKVVMLSGEEKTAVEIIKRKDGKSVILKVKKNRYVSNGGQKFIIGSVEDITEIEEIREVLMETNLALQKSNDEKDKFFSIIAHDLRSPFTGFLGLTEDMANNIESMSFKDIKENVLLLKDSAINFHNLLENLLKWSLLQRHMTDFVLDKINLKTTINLNIELIQEVADRKWIEIVNNAPDLYISADKNMIHSVIINLLSNAIKYTHKRGIITISANDEFSNDFIEISVKDTGIGMNEYTTKRLFEISNKVVSNVGTDQERGTGLGLILCKDFVEKHGGKIWVESEIGIGSIFHFTLPKAK